MELIQQIVTWLNGMVWGPAMLILILGTGFFLMAMLKGMPLLKLALGFKLMWGGREKGDQSTGDVSPFQALMTCLSATVGTGNIAGVATAIFLGGPGALFWMWCTALVGMATKYSEIVLAVHFREKDEKGEYIGGPMYAIKNGLVLLSPFSVGLPALGLETWCRPTVWRRCWNQPFILSVG